MWGAIIGDLAGSIYEYEQIKNVKSVKNTEIIPNDSFFSDDTILTIAILDAIYILSIVCNSPVSNITFSFTSLHISRIARSSL